MAFTLQSLAQVLQLDSSGRGSETIERVESLAPQPIGSVTPNGGQVQLQGRALGRRMMVFPPTQEMVIGYRLRIETREKDGQWLPLMDDTRLNEFEVHDSSGAALVHWLGPLLPATRQTERVPWSSLPEVALNELAHLDQLRWYAMLIEHDSEVFVMGKPFLRVNPHGSPDGYRMAPQQLVVRSTAGFPLLVAASSRDGLLCTLSDRLLF